MADDEDLRRLEASLQGLEETVLGAESVTTAFRAEMESVTETMRGASKDAGALSRSLGSGLKSAMTDVILDGGRLSEALRDVGRSLASTVLSSALRPVGNALGRGVGALFGGAFADGAAFSSGRVRAFAQGGVVSRATAFPMRGGTGLMGEAGPEAIMPLSRGPDGRLGVRAAGGGRPVTVNMTVTTPDVEGFRRSRSQIAAQLSRALSQGRRNQ